MKTIVYNPEREILTALLILILSFSVLTAVKAQGNSGPQLANEIKKERNEEKAVMSVYNDPASTLENEKFLALKIESWMSSGAYWDRSFEKETAVDKLASDIKKWMTDGSFWSPGKDYKTDIDELASLQKKETTCDALVEDVKQ